MDTPEFYGELSPERKPSVKCNSSIKIDFHTMHFCEKHNACLILPPLNGNYEKTLVFRGQLFSRTRFTGSSSFADGLCHLWYNALY